MATTKAQQRASAKYQKKSYDDLRIRVPKGRRADIEAAVKKKNISINGAVNQFLRELVGMSEEEWKNKEEG